MHRSTQAQPPVGVPASILAPVLAFASVPLLWMWLYWYSAGFYPSRYLLMCLLTSLMGGLSVYWIVRRRWAQRGFPSAGQMFLTFLLAFLLPLICLIGGMAYGGGETKKDEEKSPKIKKEILVVPAPMPDAMWAIVQPRERAWEAGEYETMLEKYWTNNGQKKGWQSSQPESETMSIDYPLGPKGKDGSVVDSGANTALLEGGDLEISTEGWDPYSHYLYVQSGEKGNWELVSGGKRKITLYSSDPKGVVRFKVRSNVEAGSTLSISVKVTDPPTDKTLLIPTRAFGTVPRERKGKDEDPQNWGYLPPSDAYKWRLYVRITKGDGSPLPEGYLKNTHGVILIASPEKKVWQSMLVRNETFISSETVSTTGKEELRFGLPDRPGQTFRLDVKLAITPKVKPAG